MTASRAQITIGALASCDDDTSFSNTRCLRFACDSGPPSEISNNRRNLPFWATTPKQLGDWTGTLFLSFPLGLPRTKTGWLLWRLVAFKNRVTSTIFRFINFRANLNYASRLRSWSRTIFSITSWPWSKHVLYFQFGIASKSEDARAGIHQMQLSWACPFTGSTTLNIAHVHQGHPSRTPAWLQRRTGSLTTEA